MEPPSSLLPPRRPSTPSSLPRTPAPPSSRRPSRLSNDGATPSSFSGLHQLSVIRSAPQNPIFTSYSSTTTSRAVPCRPFPSSSSSLSEDPVHLRPPSPSQDPVHLLASFPDGSILSSRQDMVELRSFSGAVAEEMGAAKRCVDAISFKLWYGLLQRKCSTCSYQLLEKDHREGLCNSLHSRANIHELQIA